MVYCIFRLSKIISQCDSSNDEHYSFLVPIMKALLEKSKTDLALNTNLPALKLRLAGPEFFEHFKEYHGGEEWEYFIKKHVTPLHDSYMTGYLSDLPMEMDVFWAECYEVSTY